MKSQVLVGLGAWFLVGLGACSGEAFEGGEEAGGAGMAGSAGQGMGGSSGQPGAGAGGGAGSAGSTGLPCGVEKFRCEADVLYVCDSASNEYVKSQPCDAGTCNAALGRCDTCVVGAALGCFNDNTLTTCNDSGSGEITKPCTSSEPFCDASGGGKCVECRTTADCKPLTDECFEAACQAGVCVKAPTAKDTPAKSQQSDDCVSKVCDGSGGVMLTSLEAGTECGVGGVCNGGGVCGVCIPGQEECAGSSSTHKCENDGQWEAMVKCPSDKPACSAAQCVGVVSITSGGNHSCSIMSNGTIRCWGSNSAGQLGVITKDAISSTPLEVTGINDVVKVTAGSVHTCALTSQGDVYCWGLRAKGLVGDGLTDGIQQIPVKVFGQGVIDISARTTHSCLVAKTGEMYCWGDNDNEKAGQSDQQGEAAFLDKPTKVASNEMFSKVSVGAEHSCGVTMIGEVFCWGSNDRGRLGASIAVQKSFAPLRVEGLPKVAGLSVGWSHSIAREMTSEKPLRHWVWGDNSYSQCFQGEEIVSLNLATLYDGNDVKELVSGVVAGNDASFVMFGIGAFGLGFNFHGQLGGGIKTESGPGMSAIESPVDIATVAPGEEHTCALQSTGKVFCWGQGSKGQLGHGDTAEHLTPVEVIW